MGKELSKYCQYDEGSCLDYQNYTIMSALPSLKVENYKHKRSTTTYGISLSEDKIIVPEEFMPIVEKIKEFDFDRVFWWLIMWSQGMVSLIRVLPERATSLELCAGCPFRAFLYL